MRSRAVHWLHRRRWLRRISGRECGVLPAPATQLRRPVGRSATVRGSDRLPDYRLAGEHAELLGIYGFGAAAHIVAQVAIHEGRRVYAFTRPGDTATQSFARELGAVWAGGSDELPPRELDAALIFAPVGALMVSALQATARGGVVVSGGIHMSDIPSFPYRLLWQERVLRSVANLTRQDGAEFMALAARLRLQIHVTPFPLEQANEALDQVRRGQIEGAAVLVIGSH